MPLPVGMVEAGVRPADSGRDGGCGLTGGSAGQPADRRTGLAHLPADGTGAEAWAGEPGAGPGGLPWPAGRPVRSAVALACPPVRTAMVDRRVHHLHGEGRFRGVLGPGGSPMYPPRLRLYLRASQRPLRGVPRRGSGSAESVRPVGRRAGRSGWRPPRHDSTLALACVRRRAGRQGRRAVVTAGGAAAGGSTEAALRRTARRKSRSEADLWKLTRRNSLRELKKSSLYPRSAYARGVHPPLYPPFFLPRFPPPTPAGGGVILSVPVLGKSVARFKM
jgi:hypothetical protein